MVPPSPPSSRPHAADSRVRVRAAALCALVCAAAAALRRARGVAHRLHRARTRIHCAGIVRLNAHCCNRRTPAALGASAVARTLLLASVRASAAPGGREGGNTLCECDAQAPPPSSHSLCARGATRLATPAAGAYTPSASAFAAHASARVSRVGARERSARGTRGRPYPF